MADPARTDVLVTGATGAVGGGVLAALAERLPGRVVAAGRDLDRARTAAAAVGPHVRAAQVGDPLDGVAVVVACAPDPTGAYARTVLAAGVDYLDISADPVQVAAVERLDAQARATGATALLSVGLAPGLSNLLAAVAAAGLDETASLELGVLLGIGDHHGAAAVEWTLDGLRIDAPVVVGGVPRGVPSMEGRMALRFRPDEAPRSAYPFPFPEPEVLARTLGVPDVRTGLALLPEAATNALSWAARHGLRGLLARPRARGWITAALALPAVGPDGCAVAVRATGTRDGAPAAVELSVDGRQEARITALVAAACASLLLERPATGGGAVHLHQLGDPERTLDRLVSASGVRRVVHAR